MALPSITAEQVDFSAGQITEKASRRDDLKLQRSGLKRSVNTRPVASGALQQRMGRSAYDVDTGRTETVRFSDELIYGFLFGDGSLRIRDVDGALLNEFLGLPWTLDTIGEIGVAVAERDVFVTYRNNRPKQLTLGSSNAIDTSLAAAFADLLDNRPYPVVEATNSSRENSEVIAHPVALPSGIVPGDLLVILFRLASESKAYTGPTGWDERAVRDNNGITTIYSRIATGSEGSTATVTVNAGIAKRSVSLSYRISGYSGTPEAAIAASNTTNPPSLTPSWGSAGDLWLAMVSMRRSDQTVTAAPASYGSLLQIGNTSNSDNDYARIAAATRNVVGSSENPGDFTVSGTANSPHAATIAVRPITDAAEAARAFDGIFTKVASQCVAKLAATSAIIGLDFTAEPQRIAGVTVYGSTDAGYVAGITPNVTVTLYGKNGSLPTLGSPGTSLGTTTFADTTDESGGRSITSSDTTTPYDYLAVVVSHDGVAATMYVAQVAFTVPAATLATNNWQIGPFLFDETPEGAKRQPYYRFALKGIEMLCSARTGSNIDVTFSEPVLDASHVGVSFRFHDREIIITAVTTALAGKANVIEILPPGRRVICSSANARDSFKLGQVVIGEDSGAEGYITGFNTPSAVTSVVTITNAYPAVVSWAAHGLRANQPISFTTTGALPAGLAVGVTYYVSATSLAQGTFQLSATPGGAVIGTSSAGSGTHTATYTNYALDVIAYKGDNFSDSERVDSPTGSAIVIGTPAEITLPASPVWDEAMMSDYRGWPAALEYDRSRLIFNNFPQLKSAIVESSIGAPNNMLIGAEATDAFMEFAPGSGRVLHVTGGADQFVLTDLGAYYIPISEANPLRPGSVSFRRIAAVGAGTVHPAAMHEGIVYATANRTSLIAIVPTGQTSFPYRTAAISEFHADLFTGVRALAAMAGGGSQAEQYLWVAQDDGTAVVGKFDSSNEWAGFMPVTGEGLIRWISSLGGDVLFNVEYDTAFDWVMEELDETQFVDCGVALNRNEPALRPSPDDTNLGRLWFLAGLSVKLMNGETYLGERVVDADGYIVEVAGDDFTGEDVTAGFAFEVRVAPYLPSLPEGEERGQRMRLRRVKRAAVHVQESTEFVFMGRTFGGAAAVSSTFRAPGKGRAYEPEVLLVKSVPGPIRITEIDAEVTV